MVAQATKKLAGKGGEAVTAATLLARWREMIEELNRAKTDDKQHAIRMERATRLLEAAEPGELELAETLVLVGGLMPEIKRELLARLHREPVRRLSDGERLAMLEAAEQRFLRLKRFRWTSLSREVSEDAEIPLGQRLADMWRLIQSARLRREAATAASVAAATSEAAFARALSQAQTDLVRGGDWPRLVAGSLVVRDWLHSDGFAAYAIRLGVAPVVLRDNLLRLAEQEGTQR